MSSPTQSADKAGDKQPAKGAKRAAATPLRRIRLQRRLTQQQLAELCNMHRNSIRKIETGLTREISVTNAKALASALEIRIEDLGLHVRTAVEAPSIRLRQLTTEQRQIVDELLSLPAEDYALLRTAVEELRKRRSRRRGRGAKR